MSMASPSPAPVKIDEELLQLLEIDLDGVIPASPHHDEALDPELRPGTPLNRREELRRREEEVLASAAFQALDTKLARSDLQDVPSGTPLLPSLVNTVPGSRSRTARENAWRIYETSILQTASLFDRLVRGSLANCSASRGLVYSLLELLVRDRSILLGLTLAPLFKGREGGEDMIDPLYRHAVNVCVLSMATATHAGYAQAQVLEIGQSALLSDVGMLLVPGDIRFKAGKLTPDELFEIHKHAFHGYSLLSKVAGITDLVQSGVYQHHERLTGNGYPRQRQGRQILRVSRIIALCDTLEAMVNKRSHREAMAPAAALDKVMKMAQVHLLDAELAQSLQKALSAFPLGSLVRLSGGRLGKVVEAHSEDPLRPVVALFPEGPVAGMVPGAAPRMQFLDLRSQAAEKVAEGLPHGAHPNSLFDGF